MPLDPRLLPLLEVLRAEEPLRGATPAERRVDLLKRRAERGVMVQPPDPRLHSVTDVHAGEVLIRIYRPSAGPLPGLVHFHGGGWWLGSVAEDDLFCSTRALYTGAAVLSVEYRLAPEHPYPAGLDDCWAAWQHINDHLSELGLSKLVLGGVSAGGNLAAAVALRARTAGGPRAAGLLLEFPGMDLHFDDESCALYGIGYGFAEGALRECAEFYGGDVADPFVSPALASLANLPPTLVTTAEYDPCRDGGERFAQAMAAAGGEVTLERLSGVGHGCGETDLMPDVTERYRASVRPFLSKVFAD